jgi:multiple sugar transport system substrate-binding protein
VDVEVISREYADHHTAMTTALATRSHLPDIMAVEVAYLGRFANSGGLTDLSKPPYDALAFRDRFVPYTYAQATATNGALSAMPGDIGPGTLFYRDDLLKKSGVTIDDMTRTWESYVAAGRKIKQASGAYLVADARDLKDVILRTALKPGEGLYFDASGRVLVDSPRFQRAFELARTVRREKLDGKSKAWSSEWSEMLRTGKVATQMMGSWLGGHLSKWLAPETAGLWRVADLPDGAHVAWGGTFYAIPAKAPKPGLAFEFIRLLTLDRNSQMAAFLAQDAFPALLAAQQDPFFEQPLPFLGGQRARALWRDTALKIQAMPINKLDPIAEEIVNAALDRVLNDDQPIAPMLTEARNRIEYRQKRP